MARPHSNTSPAQADSRFGLDRHRVGRPNEAVHPGALMFALAPLAVSGGVLVVQVPGLADRCEMLAPYHSTLPPVAGRLVDHLSHPHPVAQLRSSGRPVPWADRRPAAVVASGARIGTRAASSGNDRCGAQWCGRLFRIRCFSSKIVPPWSCTYPTPRGEPHHRPMEEKPHLATACSNSVSRTACSASIKDCPTRCLLSIRPSLTALDGVLLVVENGREPWVPVLSWRWPSISGMFATLLLWRVYLQPSPDVAGARRFGSRRPTNLRGPALTENSKAPGDEDGRLQPLWRSPVTGFEEDRLAAVLRALRGAGA